MRNSLFLSAVAAMSLVGCNKKQPTSIDRSDVSPNQTVATEHKVTPSVVNALPTQFTAQAWLVIKADMKLEQATSEGVTFAEFKALYSDSETELFVLCDMWPRDLSKLTPETATQSDILWADSSGLLNEADMYWTAALKLWTSEQQNESAMPPAVPLIVGLLEAKHPERSRIDLSRGKDEVLKDLLGIASQTSYSGRDQLKALLMK
jgi:hypothetical protein